MRRSFSILFVLVVLASISSHSDADSGLIVAGPTRAPDQTAVVTASVLNVRIGPGTGYAIARQVHEGTILPVLGEDETGQWLKVRTSDGIVGWVSAQYVAIQPSEDRHQKPPPTVSPTVSSTSVTPSVAEIGQGAVSRLHLLWANLPLDGESRDMLLYALGGIGVLLLGRLLWSSRRRRTRRAAGAWSGEGGANRPGQVFGGSSEAYAGPSVYDSSGNDRGWDTSVDPDPRRTERYEREWREREEREQAVREERWAAREEERQAWDEAIAEQVEERRAAEIQAISDYQAERAVEQWNYQQERAQERWDYEMEKAQERWERQFRDDDE